MKGFRLIVGSIGIAIMLLPGMEAKAQQGLPFITHYKLPGSMSTQTWAIEQGKNDLIYFLNRKGVFSFDGYEWENLQVKGRPLAMAFHEKLFVSTDMGIVSLEPNRKGEFMQREVKDTIYDYYHKLVEVGQTLYAVGTQNVCRVVAGESEFLQRVYAETDSSRFITDAFNLKGELYIVQNKTQVFLMRNGHAVPLKFSLPEGAEIAFTFGDGNDVFMGLSNNRVYRFTGKDIQPFVLKDQVYLDASYLNGGIVVNSSRIAFATLLGGCVVVDSKSGETIAMVNYRAGLPDDEIFSMGVDNHSGLWLAHGMGISRIDFKIPVTSYEHYPGLNGNALSVVEFQNRLYVGTSEGLYMLNEVKDFKEVEIVVKEKVPQRSGQVGAATTSNTSEVAAVAEHEKKRKSFFSRLFDKIAGNKPSEEHGEVAATESKLAQEQIVRKKKKILALQSVSYAYQKIAGVEGKCRQLVVFNDELLVVSSRGVYSVSKDKATPVVVGKYSLFAVPSGFNKKVVWVGTESGLQQLTENDGKWTVVMIFPSENELPVSVAEFSAKELLLSTESSVIKLTLNGSSVANAVAVNTKGNTFDSPVVRTISGHTMVITANHVFAYDKSSNTLSDDSLQFPSSDIKVFFSQAKVTWLQSKGDWQCYSPRGFIENPNLPYLSLFDKVNDIFLTTGNKLFLVNGYNEIVRIDSKGKSLDSTIFSLLLKSVKDGNGNLLDLDDIDLSYSDNSLRVKIAAPSFVKEKSAEFQYLIVGMMNRWSEWNRTPVLEFPFFPSGHYVLKIRARDVLGHQSKTYSLAFRIRPPFWKSIWFISLSSILLLFSLAIFIRVRERNLIKEKIVLEQRVRVRTQTIEEQRMEMENQRDALARQNEEIMQQKEEIEAQRDEIENQRDQIVKQNENITKSIEYAKRIQTAAMPSKEAVELVLPEHFIFFKPRDIVSGDFYWTVNHNGKTIVAVADCTGHGVPGAFMSMLGLSFLSEIVNTVGDLHPATILNQLRAFIKYTLSQEGNDGGSKDGMDIALCIIDRESNQLEFAGAYNPVYIIRNGALEEIKGDKMPVGIHLSEKESFTNNIIPLDGITAFYLFSDGFADQFGGPEGRKFKAKNFRELLAKNHARPMAEQRLALETAFSEWQGCNDQVDDVLVVGVRIV